MTARNTGLPGSLRSRKYLEKACGKLGVRTLIEAVEVAVHQGLTAIDKG